MASTAHGYYMINTSNMRENKHVKTEVFVRVKKKTKQFNRYRKKYMFRV